jgi:hypothetical protein
MNAKQFRRYLDRDGGCVHCGETEAVAPHHRANRGAGGSRSRDVPSNIVVLCSYMNGLIESNASAAEAARGKGWKLSSWESPAEVPLWNAIFGEWQLLDDNYGTTNTEAISK